MDQFEALKSKYASALKTVTETGTSLTHLHAQDGKLVIKGAAPSDAAKNEVWTAIKAVDPMHADVSCDLAVDPSLPTPPQVQTYTVKSGDTLGKISQHFYGKASAYMKIFEVNRDQLSDPNVIKAGQVLKIPAA
jgi:nucleoid-associated protein YgaU